MKLLFFDTETNGLPLKRNASFKLVENWPRIIQIAWQVWDVSGDPQMCNVTESIIQPDIELVWDAGSAAIHGISKERALREGLPGSQVFADFAKAAADCDVVISHNIAFDKPVILAEFHRLANHITWWPTIEYCTMENTKSICKLPSNYSKSSDPYKYPRLGELYTHLFGTNTHINFHDAGRDVNALVQCVLELLRLRLVPLDAWRSIRVRERAGDD